MIYLFYIVSLAIALRYEQCMSTPYTGIVMWDDSRRATQPWESIYVQDMSWRTRHAPHAAPRRDTSQKFGNPEIGDKKSAHQARFPSSPIDRSPNLVFSDYRQIRIIRTHQNSSESPNSRDLFYHWHLISNEGYILICLFMFIMIIKFFRKMTNSVPP
jgi:hypothetical protein